MGELFSGRVISWKGQEGYGFIQSDEHPGRDLWFHAKDVVDNAAKRPNAKVVFEVETRSARGPQAVRVRLQSAPAPPLAEGEVEVLTEAEFREEMAATALLMVTMDAFVAAARRHGWIE